MKLLNEKRLRDYPRLFFIAIWGIFLVNMIFHRGWVGRFGGIIGVDFVCIYSGGLLYRSNIQNLYDIQTQAQIQQELFQPTQLGGTVNIFTHPPHAALAYSVLTQLPLIWAFYIWMILSISCALLSLYLIYHHILSEEVKKKLSFFQLVILIFSSFPFVTGLFFGQSHIFTFFLLMSITIFMLKDKWFLAGLLAGMLMYKPHFVIGFIILWLVWKKYRAFLGLAAIAIPWMSWVVIQQGFTPYKNYLEIIRLVPVFANVEGISWESTLSALIENLIRAQSGVFSLLMFLVLFSLAGGGLAIYGFKHQKTESKPIAIMGALLLPYIVSPHILIYDLLPLTLIFSLWSKITLSRRLIGLISFTYLGTFVLPVFTKIIPLGLLALNPLVILVFLIKEIRETENPQLIKVTP